MSRVAIQWDEAGLGSDEYSYPWSDGASGAKMTLFFRMTAELIVTQF